MKRYLIPLSLICMLLLSSCGGGGVGPAPPGTVPPAITSVSPLVGQSGEQIQLATSTSGSAIKEWSWNFGNGADPNTSSKASPSVTLGTPGVYNCVVVGKNDWFETTTTFKLTVE